MKNLHTILHHQDLSNGIFFLLECTIQSMVVINHYITGSMNGLTLILIKVELLNKILYQGFIILYLECSYLQVSESTLISMLGDIFCINKSFNI